ncbi:patatin-like phospholipase family protein [Rhodococcus sp. NPDC059234]|uniref:patatin-like phospholipase family protein n=1 Tax=Rhodococcus sp. NPDC059234 TaxID=3346781 RepID=UPI0036706D24
MAAALRADLVCEGGGVRGIGLVGAVQALSAAGYAFPRVAGSSAGAIVAALVAALQHAGEPVSRLHEIMAALDYRKFEDSGLVGRIPLVGGPLSLILWDGRYRGAYLERFLAGILDDLGVRTFGDLRTEETVLRYKWSLVVTASDLSRRRLVRIPWDLPLYGLDPDEFPIARAVRASAAIPFLFEPVRIGGATWVDGGLLSNFPIDLFDRPDTLAARWPTFGIRLVAPPGLPPTHPVGGPLSLSLAMLDTLLSNQDSAYVDDPCTVRRTVFVPADVVSAIDFRISAEQSAALYERGVSAGTDFLRTWKWSEYRAECGRVNPAGGASRRR